MSEPEWGNAEVFETAVEITPDVLRISEMGYRFDFFKLIDGRLMVVYHDSNGSALTRFPMKDFLEWVGQVKAVDEAQQQKLI
jgi:hypothetical protein